MKLSFVLYIIYIGSSVFNPIFYIMLAIIFNLFISTNALQLQPDDMSVPTVSPPSEIYPTDLHLFPGAFTDGQAEGETHEWYEENHSSDGSSTVRGISNEMDQMVRALPSDHYSDSEEEGIPPADEWSTDSSEIVTIEFGVRAAQIRQGLVCAGCYRPYEAGDRFCTTCGAARQGLDDTIQTQQERISRQTDEVGAHTIPRNANHEEICAVCQDSLTINSRLRTGMFTTACNIETLPCGHRTHKLYIVL